MSGKTGTAEHGSKTPPQTRAWFVGWQGDVAFAVLVEEGRSGGTVAAPLAKAFLADLRALTRHDERPARRSPRTRRSPRPDGRGLRDDSD